METIRLTEDFGDEPAIEERMPPDPYLMDRMKIKALLEDLAVSGQVNTKLSDWMVPSEFRSVAKLIKKWQESEG